MTLSSLDILHIVGIGSAVILGIVALRLVFRVAADYPIIGVMAGLSVMFFANENPNALGDAISHITPDAIENFEIDVTPDPISEPIAEADITDENMVEYYMQQNVNFAHQVQNAPRMATAGLHR